MLTKMMKRSAFAFLLSFTFTHGITAQTAGGVSGHIADPTGANLPNVEVTLTETATAGVRSTVTTQAGDYTFTEVPPGMYTLQVKHTGFKTSHSDTFEVQVQQSVRLDFTLQVGSVTESVRGCSSSGGVHGASPAQARVRKARTAVRSTGRGFQ